MSRPQKRQRPGRTGRQGKTKKLSSLNNTTTGAQRHRLLAHLKCKAIDTITARRDLNVMHPAMRVKELREAGHPIVTVRISRADTEGRQHHNVALYTLMSGGSR
ncbi:helix-turn-helix domain-containing protein [Rhodanobacter sp. DHG33]|uniref:helix-turn-helix domain-containing protein n=1 Tax=Rhodanobacter sp. DHG33 TaxID=2775921 RepID=UPI00177BB838|nr:helix-turn-helix domain-containing protein [Rhodanobacter sp. DHG33]MBD8898370.1 helix-turn-helix domain-containing protein [Rhodanobacter sp. DHG33]